MFLQGSGVFKLVVVSLAALLLLAAPAGAAKKKACKDAGLIAKGPGHVVRIQRATRCLINRERTKRGLKRLTANEELLAASRWQASDMLEHEYFDHDRPGGPGFSDRILRFGYAQGYGTYTIGENIAWASTPISSPRKMVKLWMNSPPHRQNILTRGFRDHAIAALWSHGHVGGAYRNSGGPFLIYVNQFGSRS